MYDIKARNKKRFNRVKRRFYYHLKKLNLQQDSWKTKSTISVKPAMEGVLDRFFRKFGRDIEVYKIHATTVEEIE
ncbi:hypothetical protein GF318_04905 [Candidatus Micrarchaeota archaeon]|nr:hypothetical protein [Candidatus Micrarchaeota archaeon]